MLTDNSGANAAEYALIMALGAVFIIGGLIMMSTSLKKPLTDIAVCLADAASCADVVSAAGSLSGLGDETNPGAGSGGANSPNAGQNNPGGKGGGKGKGQGGGQGNGQGVGQGGGQGGGQGNGQGAGQGGG